MKIENIGFRDHYAFCHGHLPQGVIDGRNIDAVGALYRTGIAANANPDSGAFQGFFAQAQLHHTNDTVGRIIHGSHKGASAGTCLTMPAFVDFYAGSADDFASKAVVRLT
jgi:hypothetical protein